MRSPDGGRFLCCYHVPTTNRRGGDHCLNNSGWGANAGHPNDGDDHTMVNTNNSATGYTTTKMDQTRGHTKCYTTDCASPMSSSSLAHTMRYTMSRTKGNSTTSTTNPSPNPTMGMSCPR